MAVNSDFFPKIYDGMLNFNSMMYENWQSFENKLDDLIAKESKRYTVNHEPKIEFPFEAEYKYIHDSLDPMFSDNGGLDKLTHIFISGYLPNGKTIHPNSIEQDENRLTLSKYSQLYINGVPYNSDYTCRAEEGGWEKLNVLIIGALKTSTSTAKLELNYADMDQFF